MRIALIMNHNAYSGREFMAALLKGGIEFEVISIGNYPATNPIEEERCQGLWCPPSFDRLVEQCVHWNMPSLKDEQLRELLRERCYTLGIQGGTGILKEAVFGAFDLGMLNFHPGDLPSYRGCSAPEWQYYEGMPVVSTCHLIDHGIDSGAIYAKRRLAVDATDYHRFRASIYPQTAEFIVDTVTEIIAHNGFAHDLVPQDEHAAIYRSYIGAEKIEEIKRCFKRQ